MNWIMHSEKRKNKTIIIANRRDDDGVVQWRMKANVIYSLFRLEFLIVWELVFQMK
jgi:hypothetical protein